MRYKQLIHILFLVIFPTIVQGQGYANKIKMATEDKKKLAQADTYYDEEKYKAAYPIFKELNDKYPNEPYIMHGLAMTGLFVPGEAPNSLNLLDSIYKKTPNMDENILFNIGIAHFVNENFDTARKYLYNYTKVKPGLYDPEHIGNYYKWIEQAKKYYAVPKKVTIKNLGSKINTSDNEYAPLISLDQKILYFTYQGEKSLGGKMDEKLKPNILGDYYEDIFISKFENGEWQTPYPIGDNLNTLSNDAPIAMNNDGTKLFIYRMNSKDGGDIFYSELIDGKWTEPKNLGPNINTKHWEGSCSLSSDENTLYFASERPEGYGGRDLYKSEKQITGEWGPAVNLGAFVNTKYNEDSPFIHPLDNALFFSSEGHSSMGGYDIYLSVTNEKGMFQMPLNLGYPINTIGNEKYYILSPDSKKGYYSSERKGGFGGQDIYEVNADENILKPSALVEGIVYLNDKPGKAAIEITRMDSSSKKVTYYSNAESGKFLYSLESGIDYSVKVTKDGFEPYQQYFKLKDLISYAHFVTNIYFKSENQQKETDTIEIKQSIVATTTASDTLKIYNERLAQKDTLLAIEKVLAMEEPINNLNEEVKIVEKTEVEKVLTETAKPLKEIAKTELVEKPKEEEKPVEKIESVRIVKIEQAIENGCDTVLILTFSAEFLAADLNDPSTYKKFLLKFGSIDCSNLNFKVQIGAFKKNKNPTFKKLAVFGNPESLSLGDGYTRYTLGNFKTINDAEMLRQKTISKGQKDAWITAVYKGDRKIMKELFENNFYVGKRNNL